MRERHGASLIMFFNGFAAEPAKKATPERPRGLSWATGLVESLLYTCAFVGCAPQWVGLWLAIKVAARWTLKEEKNQEANIHLWLVGSGVSVIFGYVGAGIALGRLPCLK